VQACRPLLAASAATALALAGVTGSHRPSGIISLLTDFGYRDPFVGVMKAVILARTPVARIVDLSHGIYPQDLCEAGFWLARSYAWFPPGTVHVVVVDPGVGTGRDTLVVQADGHWFVGPDNGVMEGVLTRAPDAESRQIDIGAFGLPAPSHTFHGRDIFAPVAAELAGGRCAFEAVGPVKSSVVRRVEPGPSRTAEGVQGRVVTVDRFGNLITNLDAALFSGLSPAVVQAAGAEWPIRLTYADAEPGQVLALINAFGTLEIACRDGSAAEVLGLGRGATVALRVCAKGTER
jgi:S-adenosylmethionine hydrolase